MAGRRRVHPLDQAPPRPRALPGVRVLTLVGWPPRSSRPCSSGGRAWSGAPTTTGAAPGRPAGGDEHRRHLRDPPGRRSWWTSWARCATPASSPCPPAPASSTRSKRRARPPPGNPHHLLNLARRLIDGEQILVGVDATARRRPARIRPGRAPLRTTRRRTPRPQLRHRGRSSTSCPASARCWRNASSTTEPSTAGSEPSTNSARYRASATPSSPTSRPGDGTTRHPAPARRETPAAVRPVPRPLETGSLTRRASRPPGTGSPTCGSPCPRRVPGWPPWSCSPRPAIAYATAGVALAAALALLIASRALARLTRPGDPRSTDLAPEATRAPEHGSTNIRIANDQSGDARPTNRWLRQFPAREPAMVACAGSAFPRPR